MGWFRAVRRCGVLASVAALCVTAGWAQGQSAPTSAGPGRIICRSAASCELGVGIPASIRYHVDVSGVPDADKDRLVKQCTAKAAPCVATVTGAETKTGIKAASVKFYN
jgi:hypothetical protein